MKNDSKELKKLFGTGAKLLVAATVFSFLAIQSWNFFTFIFSQAQWYYAFLGFGLTGGGATLYFVVIKTGDADTPIKKGVALAMLLVCTIGELLTAGFGMQVEAWRSAGSAITPEALGFWIASVQVLGFAHAIALFLYYLYDDVRVWFADSDGNGRPDGFEQRKPKIQYAAEGERREPVFTPAGDNKNNSRPPK